MEYEQLKLNNQLCFRLYTASRLITGAYKPYFEPLEITFPQYLVLMVLWESDSLTVNAIAHRLLLETNTITPLLQRMEKLGLVTRTVGKTDARQHIVKLTEKGRRMQEQAKNIPQCLGSEVVEKTGLSFQELSELILVLDRFIGGLSK